MEGATETTGGVSVTGKRCKACNFDLAQAQISFCPQCGPNGVWEEGLDNRAQFVHDFLDFVEDVRSEINFNIEALSTVTLKQRQKLRITYPLYAAIEQCCAEQEAVFRSCSLKVIAHYDVVEAERGALIKVEFEITNLSSEDPISLRITDSRRSIDTHWSEELRPQAVLQENVFVPALGGKWTNVESLRLNLRKKNNGDSVRFALRHFVLETLPSAKNIVHNVTNTISIDGRGVVDAANMGRVGDEFPAQSREQKTIEIGYRLESPSTRELFLARNGHKFLNMEEPLIADGGVNTWNGTADTIDNVAEELAPSSLAPLSPDLGTSPGDRYLEKQRAKRLGVAIASSFMVITLIYVFIGQQEKLKANLALEAREIREEELAWQKARLENTVWSYNAYVREWPDGRYIDSAKTRLGDLNRKNKTSGHK